MIFELFKDKSGKFRFRLVAANGEIVMTSEDYTRKQKALQTIDSIRSAFRQEVSVRDTTISDKFKLND